MFRKKQTSRIKSLKIGSTIYTRYEKNEPDRIVVEYSELNSQIEKTRWSLPRMNDVIGSLDGYVLFSYLDLHSSFDHRALDGDSQNLSAFLAPMVFYNEKTSHGPGFSARSFQKLWDLILNGLSKTKCIGVPS